MLLVGCFLWAFNRDVTLPEKLVAIFACLFVLYIVNWAALRYSNSLNLLPATMVYVKLKKEEGKEGSFKPVIAHRETDSLWRIDPDLEEKRNEQWEFQPNEIIEIEHRIIARLYAPIAVKPKIELGAERERN